MLRATTNKPMTHFFHPDIIKGLEQGGQWEQDRMLWIFKRNRGLSSVWYIESKTKPFDGCSIWRITVGACLKIPYCGGSLNFLSLGHKWNIFFKLIRMLPCYGGSNRKQGPWPTFGVSTHNMEKDFTQSSYFLFISAYRCAKIAPMIVLKLKLIFKYWHKNNTDYWKSLSNCCKLMLGKSKWRLSKNV